MAIKQHFGILSNKHTLLHPGPTSSPNPGCFQVTDEALNIIMSVKIQTVWLCLQIPCPYYLQRHHGPWRGQKKAHWWKNSRVFLLTEIFIINKQNIPLHHFVLVNANIPVPHFCPLLRCVTERGTKNRLYSLLSHSYNTRCVPPKSFA